MITQDVEAVVSISFFYGVQLWAIYTRHSDLVKTHVSAFPDAFFPSVSAVIGDYYPMRSIFQFGMALTSYLRFHSILEDYKQWGSKSASFFDIVKTLGIGLFTYVTSRDSPNLHALGMVLYMAASFCALQLKWFRDQNTRWMKLMHLYLTTATIVTMSALLKLHLKEDPSAYSFYSILEWCLPAFDVVGNLIQSCDDKADRLAYARSYFNALSSTLPTFWSAMLFWTHVTALPMTVWYFPLWKLGLSGYEMYLLAYFSPLLIANRRARALFSNRFFAVWFPMFVSGTCTFLGSYYVWSPQTRLALTALSTSLSFIDLIVRSTQSRSIVEKSSLATTYILGLVGTLVLRGFNSSINPLWITVVKSQTQTGFLLIVNNIIAFSVLFRQLIRNNIGDEGTKSETHNSFQSTSILDAVQCGTCMFLVHSLYTSSQALFYWNSATGHPIVAQISVITLTTIFAFKDVHRWIYYLSLGVIPAFYQIVGLLGQIVQSPMKLVVFSTVYTGLLLADVWTVAYAFVPFGYFMREKSQLVYFIALTIQGVYRSRRVATMRINYGPMFAVSKTIAGLGIYGMLLCSSLSGHLSRSQPNLVQITDPNVLTVGIWTMHFGMDVNGRLAHKGISDLVGHLDLDVVGLLESDTMRPVTGNRDMTLHLAEKLNMHRFYGPPPSKHTWGCSLLSKYPIQSAKWHLLPSPVGELACSVEAIISLPSGKTVNLYVSHNGQEEDLGDRIEQTTALSSHLSNLTGPTIFAGYLVTKAGSGNEIYDIVSTIGKMKDVMPTDKNRWCQYIFYKDILPIGYARVSAGAITDTELQTAKFWVGNDTKTVRMQKKNLYPTDLEEDWNGHRYHVYRKPIYDPTNYQAKSKK